MASHGVTAEQLAGLPGMPSSRRAVHRRAQSESWSYVERVARGGRIRLYSIATLPSATQIALVEAAANTTEPATVDGLTVAQRIAVTERLPLVTAIATLLQQGARSVDAVTATVAATCSHSARTLRRWWDLVRDVALEEWPARLAPGWRAGRVEESACHPEVWSLLLDDYLRLQRPALASCYRRVQEIAAAQGWAPVPTLHAMRRRIAREVSRDVLLLRREGQRAFDRSLPPQRRDRSGLVALQIVNADGHRFDVMVLWPDGTYERPFLVGYQDVRSGKILSWRVDRSENIEPARLAFADLVATYGIPQHLFLDNGRAWASKSLSGGTKTRYRGRILAEDPQGVFTVCGVDVHWTRPYHGQSKPIERAWRDLCGDIAKHPAFDGAYLGNAPQNRPENWRKERAVPLADFLRVVQIGITEHNAREGRAAVQGRSFDAVFAESYEVTPIRKLTETQRRALWLSSSHRKVLQNCTVSVFGATYTSTELRKYRGLKVTLRIDPENLAAGAYAYACDGAYIGFCNAIGATAFIDKSAAQEHARAHRGTVKAAKREADALRTRTPAEIGRLHVEAASKPAESITTKVVRPEFGDTLPRTPVKVGMTAAERKRQSKQGAAVIEIGRGSAATLDERDGANERVIASKQFTLAALADQRR